MTPFPPVDQADEDGLLAMGGDLEVATLKLAYASGIFPWPVAGMPLLWFAPPRRAILEFSEFRIPPRLQRYLKHASFEFRVDTNFAAVIRECAASKNRRGERGTWITKEMIAAYIKFHRHGFAHSFEAWNTRNELVGGLYGVWIGRFFAGESMFYKETNASKFVLAQTVNFLKQAGLSWMDVQVLTPLLKSFGAKEIPRASFMKKLHQAMESKAD